MHPGQARKRGHGITIEGGIPDIFTIKHDMVGMKMAEINLATGALTQVGAKVPTLLIDGGPSSIAIK